MKCHAHGNRYQLPPPAKLLQDPHEWALADHGVATNVLQSTDEPKAMLPDSGSFQTVLYIFFLGGSDYPHR